MVTTTHHASHPARCILSEGFLDGRGDFLGDAGLVDHARDDRAPPWSGNVVALPSWSSCTVAVAAADCLTFRACSALPWVVTS